MTNHIIISNTVPRIRYVSNGVLATYTFPFAIFTSSDLKVYFDSTLQTASTYTVSGAGSSSGGSITLSTIPASGVIITLTRELSIERTSDFQEGGTLRADTLNQELDYQIACQQQIADNLNRSMVLPPYAADINVNLTLPLPSAGKAIVWNEAGTNLENSTVSVNAMESTIRGYKTAAESAATTATTKATEATTQATTATEQASIATQKAQEATTTVSSKADISMDNLSSAGKQQVAYLSMPSNEYIDLTLGSSGSTYTAPANGYIFLTKTTSGTNQSCQLFVNGGGTRTNCIYMSSMTTNPTASTCSTWIPVRKDDVITYNYTAGGALAHFRFVYAQGELS